MHALLDWERAAIVKHREQIATWLNQDPAQAKIHMLLGSAACWCRIGRCATSP